MYFLVIVCMIGACLAAILLWRQCRPYQLLWDHSLKGSCWSPRRPIIYHTVYGGKLFVLKHITEDALTDDSLFRIKRSKIGLSAVLGLGIMLVLCD